MGKWIQTFVKGCTKPLHFQKSTKVKTVASGHVHPFFMSSTKRASPRLQTWGRAVLQRAGKCWSHTGHSGRADVTQVRSSCYSWSSRVKAIKPKHSFKASGAHLLVSELCHLFSNPRPKTSGLQNPKGKHGIISSREVLLNKSSIQNCNYEEARKAWACYLLEPASPTPAMQHVQLLLHELLALLLHIPCIG